MDTEYEKAFEKKYKTKDMDAGYNYIGNHGKNTMDIDCPFCGESHTVYIWSFAGCGKRCSCGAKLTYGGAYKERILLGENEAK